MTHRVAVIGGGLVGLASARALLRQGHEVTVFEKEDDWVQHQSGRNSGVIHSGLYYAPGSLKARFATEAARSLPQLCEELGVTARTTGKLVVATRAEELPRMRALCDRGRANGVPVRELSVAEAREYEPHIRTVGALHVASTGVCDYPGLGRALAQQLEQAGARLVLGARVTKLSPDTGGVRVWIHTRDGETSERFDSAVNCSGLHSDRLLPASLRRTTRIVPFRGEYWTLTRPELIRGLVYPVPDPALPFLGVHFTRGWDGHVHIGPNAVLAFRREGYRWRDISAGELARSLSYPGLWRLAGRNLGHGVTEISRSLSQRLFLRAARAMLPELTAADITRAPAGVRAQAVSRDGSTRDDFVIHAVGPVLHVVNAPSPAATACVQIGGYIAAQHRERLTG